MTIKTFSKKIYISCVHRDTYLYVNFEKHIWSFSWLFFHDSQSWIIIIYFCRLSALSFIQVVGAKFLESGNLLLDSYTLIRILTRLTIYIYYSRLSVYDIVNLVTVSLLNVLVIIIRFVLEPISFACVTAPIHLILFVLRFNVPVNNFSFMSGRSHRFLGN